LGKHGAGGLCSIEDRERDPIDRCHDAANANLGAAHSDAQSLVFINRPAR
jgi:hypothetical protein